MTWLSRLRPQNRSVERLAASNRDRRTWQRRRRRRTSSLESLERRALLAGNVTVSQVDDNGVLTITGDTHSDTFTITEDGGNEVTVTGTNYTTINRTFGPVYRFEVIDINVVLPSGLVVNTDNVELTQTGSPSGIGDVSFTVTPSATVSPIVAADLNLTVVGVTNTGTFTLSDGSATSPGGTLDAVVEYSAFAAISITQSGCCPADVYLFGDITPGPVSVTEGWDYGNQLVLDYDKFGATSLTQGFGPGEGTPGNVGAEQDTYVENSYLANLSIVQNGSGGTNLAYVVYDEVQLASFGIDVTQPNSGGADVIYIVSISTLGRPTNRIPPVLDSIFTDQGDGDGDTTYVANATVYGDITSFQGNGNYDEIYWFADNVAYAQIVGAVAAEVQGTGTISQGNGYEDSVVLNNDGPEYVAPDTFNNLYIFQGNSTPPSISCFQITGDVIAIDATIITSDLFIEQGVSGASYGENIVAIANNFFGYSTVTASTPVSVGDSTYINEVGANSGDNSIYLGGINPPDTGYGSPTGLPDFETAFLDVYTGALGGAYVQVFNTVVDVGNDGLFGGFGAYEIEGGGGSNIAVIDVFSFYLGGVDADPNVFNILLV